MKPTADNRLSPILALFTVTVIFCFMQVLVTCVPALAADADSAPAKWVRKEQHRDDMGGEFTLKATLYTAECVNELIANEAEKNLWTAAEMEDYKYNFLREIRMNDFLAVYLEIENLGPSAHMTPFNEFVYMWIGGKKYSPVEYEPRFNFPLQGSRDGMVFFPRYDEKTGKELINKDMSIRFVMLPSASPILGTKEIRMTWDVKSEAGALVGTAADRMEVDRLLRRVENLANERNALETQLEAKNTEIDEIMKRIEELQGRR